MRPEMCDPATWCRPAIGSDGACVHPPESPCVLVKNLVTGSMLPNTSYLTIFKSACSIRVTCNSIKMQAHNPNFRETTGRTR